MADKKGIEGIIAAMLGDLDVDDALAVLEENGLPVAYSDEAAAKLHDLANAAAEAGAAAKASGATADERKAHRATSMRYLNARALLYRLRGTQPGDVTVGVQPVGAVPEVN